MHWYFKKAIHIFIFKDNLKKTTTILILKSNRVYEVFVTPFTTNKNKLDDAKICDVS